MKKLLTFIFIISLLVSTNVVSAEEIPTVEVSLPEIESLEEVPAEKIFDWLISFTARLSLAGYELIDFVTDLINGDIQVEPLQVDDTYKDENEVIYTGDSIPQSIEIGLFDNMFNLLRKLFVQESETIE